MLSNSSHITPVSTTKGDIYSIPVNYCVLVAIVFATLEGVIQIFSVTNREKNDSSSNQDGKWNCCRKHMRQQLPKLPGVLNRISGRGVQNRPYFWFTSFCLGGGLILMSVGETTNLRDTILEGNATCFEFIPGKKLFQLTCPVLYWKQEGYTNSDFIGLSSNEIFDGNDGIIDLNGIDDWLGAFVIETDVEEFCNAPVIRNVHVRHGKLANNAGFIVQGEQKYFIVESCSSAGDITPGRSSGGICGEKAGKGAGKAKIVNSFSTGRIGGNNAGGIAGYFAGQGGSIDIIQCYSTGNIERTNGGGIIGSNPGSGDGYVHIQECFSSGQISGDSSGGIIGPTAADNLGEVYIVDCYSLGDISGSYAGGIAGEGTGGGSLNPTGIVNIKRSYAAGVLESGTAGGIIGSIPSSFEGSILVEFSVYNGQRILGSNEPTSGPGTVTFNANSDTLDAIRGQLYQSKGKQVWDDQTWVINGTDSLPILNVRPAEIGEPECARSTALPTPTTSPTPSSTMSVTPTSSTSSTPTSSQTPSKSSTPSSSTSSAPTSSQTPSKSSTSTSTSSRTPTASLTRTPTSSNTPTSSGTPTSTGCFTPTSLFDGAPGSSDRSENSTLSSGDVAALATSLIVLFLLGLIVIIFRKQRSRRSATSANDASELPAIDKSANADEGTVNNSTKEDASPRVEVSDV